MTRLTDRERAAELDTQIATLREKKRALDVKLQTDERKRTARQNIIVGAWLRQQRPDVFQEAVKGLTRPQDVKAFQ